MTAFERQVSKYIFKILWELLMYTKCLLTPESFTQIYISLIVQSKKRTVIYIHTNTVCLLHKYVTQDKLFLF